MVDARRARPRNSQPIAAGGAVLYWMQRDQRVQDNWALLHAAEVAKERGVSLLVLFNLVPIFGKTTLRHYDFMFRGLAEVELELRSHGIAFYVTTGLPTETLPAFVANHQVGEVVTDFNPLRFTDEWRAKVGEQLLVRLTEVDAHNIIPCWVASDKQEFAAYTFRPKVHRQLSTFLTNFPPLKVQHPAPVALPDPVDWNTLLSTVETDRAVLPVDWLVPGYVAGMERLNAFVSGGIYDYQEQRNDPNENALSHLSPYLHFGQIAPQRVALTVRDSDALDEAKEVYLEELIVRRELTDNFCFYNPWYDRVEGAHAWAQSTIAEHANDPREYVYTATQLEAAVTHDDLWNAMQRQMMQEGKMHGWCRMYWAKKILEWTPDAQTAVDIALYLNDKYELDGTDPNGIVGVMWSICGVHDRAWNERPIFGKIRYMNYAGAKRKFDVAAYVERYAGDDTLFDA